MATAKVMAMRAMSVHKQVTPFDSPLETRTVAQGRRGGHSMKRLKPLDETDRRLSSDRPDAWIYDNRLEAEGVVVDNEDIGGPFCFRQYCCGFPLEAPDEGQSLLILDGQPVVSAFVATVEDVTSDLVEAVRRDLRRLPEPLYEIWHRDHPMTSPPHVPDPWGSTSVLLERLRARVPLMMPPSNHEKVSSRREDRFGRNHMHVDSFFGMRADETGQRATFDRYFFNLGSTSRDILVAAFAPICVGDLLPDEYVPDSGQGVTRFLDPLLDAAEWSVPLVCFTTPPVDWQNHRFHGVKIRVTHALHGEFGASDDLLAVLTTALL
jgi:hypothetical protein